MRTLLLPLNPPKADPTRRACHPRARTLRLGSIHHDRLAVLSAWAADALAFSIANCYHPEDPVGRYAETRQVPGESRGQKWT